MRDPRGEGDPRDLRVGSWRGTVRYSSRHTWHCASASTDGGNMNREHTGAKASRKWLHSKHAWIIYGCYAGPYVMLSKMTNKNFVAMWLVGHGAFHHCSKSMNGYHVVCRGSRNESQLKR